MPCAAVPQYPTIAHPVLRRRPNVTIATFNPDLKVGLLEFVILGEVEMFTTGT